MFKKKLFQSLNQSDFTLVQFCCHFFIVFSIHAIFLAAECHSSCESWYLAALKPRHPDYKSIFFLKNKLQYLSETVGTAEPTKLDDVYNDMEKNIDTTYELITALVAGVNEYLQPNPGKFQLENIEVLLFQPPVPKWPQWEHCRKWAEQQRLRPIHRPKECWLRLWRSLDKDLETTAI